MPVYDSDINHPYLPTVAQKANNEVKVGWDAVISENKKIMYNLGDKTYTSTVKSITTSSYYNETTDKIESRNSIIEVTESPVGNYSEFFQNALLIQFHRKILKFHSILVALHIFQD